MKKWKLFSTGLLLSLALNCAFAQNQYVADFENLSVPASGYYDGSTDHSGTMDAPEAFDYSSQGAGFTVYFTESSDGYSYWTGMAYSNQTDLETADYTNYSAYAAPAGGVDGSDNYGIFFPSWGLADSVVFDAPVDPVGVYITNSVWAYHYIMGTDGVGTGTYEAGDYFTLTISAYDGDDTFLNSVDVNLADYTGGAEDVIDNWQWVDLTSLENVSHIKFALSSSDSWTPTYFCMDNLSYETATGIAANLETTPDVYPNPFNDYVTVSGAEGAVCSLYDVRGKCLFHKGIHESRERINLQKLSAGLLDRKSVV